MGRKPISSNELDQNPAHAPVQLEQGHDSGAEQLFLDQIRDAGNDIDRYFLYLNYGDLLMRIGRWEDSSEILIQSAQTALHLKNDLWLARSHEKLGDLSAAGENWFGALHHYRYAMRNATALLDRSVAEKLETKANAMQRILHARLLSKDANIIPLGKEYTSDPVAISFVHRDIFLKSYFARCLECNFCHDWCCSFGADIDIQNVEKIREHREEIQPFIRKSEVEWFETEYTYYEEYAGNQYTRINPQGTRCVFISKDQRGCGLHRYAITKGMDYHEIKPLVCILFPLSFEEGILSLAPELDDNSLVCSGAGASAYRALRNELEHYFGPEFTEEIDAIEKRVLQEKKSVARAQNEYNISRSHSQNA
jgi:Fe-S-cluster containining protein